MNPLIPTDAIQLRYYSPIYEPIYDEDDNVIDEECVRSGSDVYEDFIKPTHDDGIPRYYRLRYSRNAKDHKRRWEQWINNKLGTSDPIFVRVCKIGRRVLFKYDPKLVAKHEKKLKTFQFLRDKINQEPESAAGAADIPGSFIDEMLRDIDLDVARELQERMQDEEERR